ncbi:MAG: Mur ligase domain-containing protein, partial [Bacteroidia bacterium]
MDLKNLKHIYFLGIGGIGMSALARYFKAMGKNVSGYDKTPTKLTDELIAEGIDIHFEDHIRNIPAVIKELPYDIDNILIVYTPAVPKDHSEYVFFNLNGFNIKKRAEVLGMITETAHTIAVAGTHGKTTTSSLIAHILKTAGLDPSAFLGGITQNYNTNLLLSENLKIQDPKSRIQNLIVVEADEYDRSFLTLHPEIAVITSVDADHLDIYGDEKFVQESYSLFSRQVKSKLILKKSILAKVDSGKKAITYSASDETADYFAQEIKID